MESPRRKRAAVQPTKVLGPLQTRLVLPASYEGDVAFANHLGVMYQEGVFILLVARGMSPLVTTRQELQRAAREGIQAKVLAEYAIPADKFIEAIGNFTALIERMQKDGLLRPAAPVQEG